VGGSCGPRRSRPHVVGQSGPSRRSARPERARDAVAQVVRPRDHRRRDARTDGERREHGGLRHRELRLPLPRRAARRSGPASGRSARPGSCSGPRRPMSSEMTALADPDMIAAIAITVATPITTPRMVRKARTLLERSDSIAIADPSRASRASSWRHRLLIRRRATIGSSRRRARPGTLPPRAPRPTPSSERQPIDQGATLAGIGETAETEPASSTPSPIPISAPAGERARLDQELEQDVAPPGAERLAQADLTRPLGDGDQHDVHDHDPPTTSEIPTSPGSAMSMMLRDPVPERSDSSAVSTSKLFASSGAQPVADPHQPSISAIAGADQRSPRDLVGDLADGVALAGSRPVQGERIGADHDVVHGQPEEAPLSSPARRSPVGNCWIRTSARSGLRPEERLRHVGADHRHRRRPRSPPAEKTRPASRFISRTFEVGGAGAGDATFSTARPRGPSTCPPVARAQRDDARRLHPLLEPLRVVEGERGGAASRATSPGHVHRSPAGCGAPAPC
jgi:hypothetical protein